MTISSAPDNELTLRCGQYPPHQRMPAHTDQRSRLSIVVAGRVLETADGRDEYAKAGSVAIKPGHIVHQNTFGPEGARVLSIELPNHIVAESSASIVDRWRWFHGGPLMISATRVWLTARSQQTSDGRLADALIDLIAVADEIGRPNATGSPPGWLSRVRARLHEERTGACRLTALAVEAGVHPMYLARMFRRYFGCSVIDYAQALRLSAAVERMTTTDETLVTIAASAGYADQSHLNRACRRGLGQTPRRCRSLLTAAEA